MAEAESSFPMTAIEKVSYGRERVMTDGNLQCARSTSPSSTVHTCKIGLIIRMMLLVVRMGLSTIVATLNGGTIDFTSLLG